MVSKFDKSERNIASHSESLTLYYAYSIASLIKLI